MENQGCLSRIQQVVQIKRIHKPINNKHKHGKLKVQYHAQYRFKEIGNPELHIIKDCQWLHIFLKVYYGLNAVDYSCKLGFCRAIPSNESSQTLENESVLPNRSLADQYEFSVVKITERAFSA